jgi:polyketide synthase-associated protein
MPRSGAEESEEQEGGTEDAEPRHPLPVVFPGEYEEPEFVRQIISDVRETGYCLVQMPPLAEDERKLLAQEIRENKDWTIPNKDVEAMYLGKKNATKMVTLPEDPEGPLESTDMMPMLDRSLTTLTLALYPHTRYFFGFESFGRLHTYLRVPFSVREDMALRDTSSSRMQVDELRFAHINFLERRKLCFFYLVDGAEAGGAQVTLIDDSNVETTITMKPSSLLVFRHDLLSQIRAGRE